MAGSKENGDIDERKQPPESAEEVEETSPAKRRKVHSDFVTQAVFSFIPGCMVRVQHETLQDALKAHGRKVPVRQPSDFITHQEGFDHIQKVLAMEFVSQVEAWAEQQSKYCTPPKELLSALSKGQKSVSGHIKARASKLANEQKKKKREEEKAQLVAAKARAKAAATTILRPTASINSQQCAIAEVNIGLFTNIKCLGLFEKEHLGDEPVLLQVEKTKPLAVWLGDEKVNTALLSWANQYKKMTDLKDGGRCQRPWQDKPAKAATATMLEAVSPLDPVDISSVSGGGSFHKQVWAFGFAETMVHASFTPQCGSLLRILIGGELDVYCVDVAALTALGSPLSESSDTAALVEAFVGMTKEQAKELQEKGFHVHHTIMRAPSAIWIPQGCLVIEKTRKGPLVYGVRKSFFTSGSKHLERLQDAGRILKNGACNSVERHNAVAALVEKQTAEQED